METKNTDFVNVLTKMTWMLGLLHNELQISLNRNNALLLLIYSPVVLVTLFLHYCAT